MKSTKQQKKIEFVQNKWGILEVYEDGKYAGVIATWPNPDEALGRALLAENDRVHALKEKGILPEPIDWSEYD